MKKEKIKEEYKVGLYTRVSSREQAMFGYGLQAQEKKGISYLKLFEYPLASMKIYRDEGISAKDLNRPALKRLLKDVEQEKINMIVIYKLDRLARNVIDVYKIISTIMEYKCNLISVMDHLDIYSANGRMLVGMLAIIAQWEREVITERTLDGLTAMVRQGKYPYPGVPFGWNKNANNYLSINEEQAKIINEMGDMAILGYSIREIGRFCANEFKVKCSDDVIKKRLLRDINIGIFKYHGEIYSNVVPAIYSKEKADKIIKMISRRLTKWDTNKYYFANKVLCSCKTLTTHKVTNKKDKRYYYYYCDRCGKRINQEKVLEQTLPEIFLYANHKKRDETERVIVKLLDGVITKIERIYEMYMRNEVNEKVYAYTLAKLRKDKEQYQDRLKNIQINSYSVFKTGTDEVKKQFIQGIVENVIVDMELQLVIQIIKRKK